MIISMKLCRKKAENMHMVVIWEFRENHVIRRITKDLARIQPRNEARAKKVARGRCVQKCSAKEESRAKEDSREGKNKSREEIAEEDIRAKQYTCKGSRDQRSRASKTRAKERVYLSLRVARIKLARAN